LGALGSEALMIHGGAARVAAQVKFEPVHPPHPTIRGVGHLVWAGKPRGGADGRNAVFYGVGAIDRHSCGTGTSARLAHLAGTGRLRVDDRFVHESDIGSRFVGRVEVSTTLGDRSGIIPSVEGSTTMTGLDAIWIDRGDRFGQGFEVK
jgi:4-hydroxyproline epimerase